MKKIYMALIFVFCALCTVQTCSVTACAAKSDTVEYDIQIESLDASSDAKELNKYRKAILKNLNRAVRYLSSAAGVETDYYTRLTLDDLVKTRLIFGKKHAIIHKEDLDEKEDFLWQ